MLYLKEVIAKLYLSQRSLKVALACGLIASLATPSILYFQAQIESHIKNIERSHIASLNLQRSLSYFLGMESAARGYVSVGLLKGGFQEQYVDSVAKNSNLFDENIVRLQGYLPESVLLEAKGLKVKQQQKISSILNVFESSPRQAVVLMQQNRQLSDNFRSLVAQNESKILAEQDTAIATLDLLLILRFINISILSSALVGMILAIAWRNRILMIQQQADACQIDIMNNVKKEKAKTINGLSHDIRLHLQPILSATELIKRSGNNSPEKLSTWLERIIRGVSRIEGLTNDLNLISASELGTLKADLIHCSLDDLVYSIVHDFTHASSRHRVVCTVKGQPEFAMLDEGLCDRAVRNLIGNAIKYSPEGGLVYVCVDLNRLAVAVCDEGIGIPEGMGGQLFEAFQRADNVGAVQGFGLGLSVVKVCAVAHGGSVFVKSPATLDGMEFKTLFELRLK